MFRNVDSLRTDDSWIKNLRSTFLLLFAWLLLSFLLLLLCALKSIVDEPTRHGISIGISIFCHGSFLSLAFGAVGGLVGFLFGVPKTGNSDTGKDSKPTGQPSSNVNGQDSTSDNNTNLEQISDWLTKIILGAGLVQLSKVPSSLKAIGEFFRDGFAGNATLPLVLVMHSLVLGFFVGYLITRLFLLKAFSDADKAQGRLKIALSTAGTLEQSKHFTAAAATLENALSALGPDTPKDTKRSLFERLIYNSLYEDPPQGFRRAIQYGERYVQEEPGTPSARVFAYLAAAFGQKYKWDRDVDKVSPEALAQTRQRTLEVASQAIKLEPQMKDFLRRLWDRNDPTKVSSEENDLEVFFDDPEFRNLLMS